MEASIRPWFATGVALVGAGAIAMTPISPIPTTSPASEVRAATAAISSQFDLTAVEWPYILSLPIVRQQIRNWGANWAVYLAGLGKAGVGVVDSLLAIPGVTVEIIQEIFALNLVGAFDTFATAVRDSVVAIGQPLLDSVIWRNQKYLVVQAALESAVPRAWIDLANGFLAAGNVVTTSLIQGTQDFVAAVLTFNLGNIIDATLEGTKNFFVALGDGAGSIIAGIEAAQRGISAALATPPPPPPDFNYRVSDVAGLRTLAVDNTVSLTGKQDVAPLEQPVTDTADLTVVKDLEPSTDPVVVAPVDETTETDVVDTAVVTEPVDATVPVDATAPETTPVSDVSDDEADAADPVKETPKAEDVAKKDPVAKKVTAKKDAVKDAVNKLTARAKKDAGSDKKSSSDSGE
ncbi:hypothetical protein [Mycolicibacterium sp. 624]|uniref:hypothetical protein n=1 Tax=Mycolicibacterium sp. 624 TaxID=3156314 RepID=UPI003392DAEF